MHARLRLRVVLAGRSAPGCARGWLLPQCLQTRGGSHLPILLAPSALPPAPARLLLHPTCCPALQIDGTTERGLVSRFQLQGGYHAVFHINGTETRLYCDGHACEGQRLATKQARQRPCACLLGALLPTCLHTRLPACRHGTAD